MTLWVLFTHRKSPAKEFNYWLPMMRHMEVKDTEFGVRDGESMNQSHLPLIRSCKLSVKGVNTAQGCPDNPNHSFILVTLTAAVLIQEIIFWEASCLVFRIRGSGHWERSIL